MKFRLNSGRYADLRVASGANDKTYVKGDIVESEIDLAKNYPKKFTKISSSAKATHSDSDVDEGRTENDGNGLDVTLDFKRAVEYDVLVFQTADGFNVVDSDSDTVLNGTPLKKNKVEE